MIHERALTFGPGAALVGVLSEPGRSLRRDVPAVLLWNVGVNHRVGPSRVWVDLARRLVRAGFVVFRFDLGGLGDSEPRRDGSAEGEAALSDIRDAMDAVTRETGITRFAVTGFCSGVDSAHAIAAMDRRVVGAAFVEGYTYPTLLHRVRRPLRVLELPRWQRWLTRRFPRLAGDAGPARDLAAGEPIFVREYPKEERFSAEVRQMLDDGKRLLFVYAGANRDHYSYTKQIRDVLGRFRGRNVEVAFIKRADHVFSRAEDRLALLDRMTVFFDTRFDATPRRLP
jgi:alpha/beta superfamily hydrolase